MESRYSLFLSDIYNKKVRKIWNFPSSLRTVVEHVLCILIFELFLIFVDSAEWALACLDVWVFIDWCVLLWYSNAERADQDQETGCFCCCF